MKRVLVATLGSWGDLFPSLALSKALQSRGLCVRLAANPSYESVVAGHQVEFIPLGRREDPTDIAPTGESQGATGFIERTNFSQLERLFEDLLQAAASSDAIVAPYFVVPAHLVAERLDLPFFACVFSPAHILVDRRPKPPPHWHACLSAFRRSVGLPRKLLPYMEVLNSPAIILGLFPRFLLPPGTRTMEKLRVVGHARLERPFGPRDDEGGKRFCDKSTVVFSFGSYADRESAHRLFMESMSACHRIGLKCLYVSRFASRRWIAPDMLAHAHLVDFADHDDVFPSSLAVVHHGGLGTLMAACRHAMPMVTVPFGYDQPYHAARMADLAKLPAIAPAAYDHLTLSSALEEVISRAGAIQTTLKNLMEGEVDGAEPAAAEISACIQVSGTR